MDVTHEISLSPGGEPGFTGCAFSSKDDGRKVSDENFTVRRTPHANTVLFLMEVFRRLNTRIVTSQLNPRNPLLLSPVSRQEQSDVDKNCNTAYLWRIQLQAWIIQITDTR